MEQHSEHDSSWNKLTSTEQTKSILGILMTIAVVMAALSWLSKDDLTLADFGVNLSTELFGAAITFYFLSVILEQTKKKEEKLAAKEELKAKLIQAMGSQVNDVAVQAVEELRRLTWLEDGSLVDIKISRANLKEAPLWNAKLQKSEMILVNLQDARLFDADLQEADLALSKLNGAYLGGANLLSANLNQAILQEANLNNTNLTLAHLVETNLQKAKLFGTNLQGQHYILLIYERLLRQMPTLKSLNYGGLTWQRQI